MSESRDFLRGKTVGRVKKLVIKKISYRPPIYKDNDDGTVTLDGYEDEIWVEVRQPTVGQRNDLVAKCRREDGSIDELEFIVQSALNFVYVPGTTELLFDKQDYNNLLEQPAGGFVDQFSTEAIQLLNMEGGPEKNSKS